MYLRMPSTGRRKAPYPRGVAKLLVLASARRDGKGATDRRIGLVSTEVCQSVRSRSREAVSNTRNRPAAPHRATATATALSLPRLVTAATTSPRCGRSHIRRRACSTTVSKGFAGLVLGICNFCTKTKKTSTGICKCVSKWSGSPGATRRYTLLFRKKLAPVIGNDVSHNRRNIKISAPAATATTTCRRIRRTTRYRRHVRLYCKSTNGNRRSKPIPIASMHSTRTATTTHF